jgi:hypothetical protein
MHILPWFCAVSRCFRNRGHDCTGPRVSRSVVTNCCLGKCQTRCYGIHVAHLGASKPIKCHHVSAGGTAPPLQSRQVQISSKLHGGKYIAPPADLLPLLRWARGPLSVPYRPGTLRTRPKSSPTVPDPAPSTGGLQRPHVSCDIGPASR